MPKPAFGYRIPVSELSCIVHPSKRYQEIPTDLSYAGQFVWMTNPHIDNTGINTDDKESYRWCLGELFI